MLPLIRFAAGFVMLLVKTAERCVFVTEFNGCGVATAWPPPHIVLVIAVTTSEFGGALGGAVTVGAGTPLTTPVDVVKHLVDGDDDDEDDDAVDVAVELATAALSSALRCLCAARILRMRATIA